MVLRQKILQIAEEYNYTNTRKRDDLNSKNTNDIGIIIPTVANPFYLQLLLGIESICSRNGYIPSFCSSRRDPEVEKVNLKMLIDKKVSGIILSSISNNPSYLKKISAPDIPIVVFDQSIKELDFSYVKFNYHDAGKMAVEYLYLKGHRKIGFASSPILRPVRQELFDGFMHGLETFSIADHPEYIFISEYEGEQDDTMYDFENGVYLADKILQLEDKPTAIFTLNDTTAYGIIERFRQIGISVPRDISVIGFDNLEMSRFFYPKLTTINQPAYEIGRLTSKILLDKIKQPDMKNMYIDLKPSIVERDSVRALY